ncbi:hypothetical protein [Cupriavidus necator]|uniref:hypothetical protein n=1 Tax=Cupriavidus necator TaxID=106590 RepID=UPI00339D692A
MTPRPFQWRDIFLHPAAAWTLGLVIVHQSVIAASSYFLTRLIEIFQAGGDFTPYLSAYLAAMLLPYLPGCASLLTLQLWINRAHRAFSEHLPESTYALTEHHRNIALRETIESVYSRNSFVALRDYLTFIHDFASLILNSALSMLVLSLLLPGNLALGYTVSILAAAALILLLRRSVHSLSTRTEACFIAYSETLSHIWDNSVLGNQYNFDLWRSHRDELASRYYKCSNKLQLAKQGGNLALAFISLTPTIYLMVGAVYSRTTEPALIAAVFVSLTRIFHILNSLSALVYRLLDFTAVSARIQVLMDAERSLTEPGRVPDTPCSSISINGSPVHHYEPVVEAIRNSSKGRFTIRGANGSGKSTLLHVLKKALSCDALLVPSHHGKLHWRSASGTQSTGQRTVAQLMEIASHPEARYLLLDEWDANLDASNKQVVDEMLENLSKQRVVVEIRH